LLEDKGYSPRFTTAGAACGKRSTKPFLIRNELPHAPIEVLPGKCVFEIKQVGFDKAMGVRELMRREPFRGRRPIFIGDDVTDESVFVIMPDLGGLPSRWDGGQG
jgi:trehalose 6-phosphate phosphatase